MVPPSALQVAGSRYGMVLYGKHAPCTVYHAYGNTTLHDVHNVWQWHSTLLWMWMTSGIRGCKHFKTRLHQNHHYLVKCSHGKLIQYFIAHFHWEYLAVRAKRHWWYIVESTSLSTPPPAMTLYQQDAPTGSILRRTPAMSVHEPSRTYIFHPSLFYSNYSHWVPAMWAQKTSANATFLIL